jgi:hypothetical protein
MWAHFVNQVVMTRDKITPLPWPQSLIEFKTIVPRDKDFDFADFYLKEMSSYPSALIEQLIAEYYTLSPAELTSIFEQLKDILIRFNRHQLSSTEYSYLILSEVKNLHPYPDRMAELVTTPEQLQKLYAIDNEGNRIYLVKSLSIQEDQNVYLGNLNGREVVVKWIHSAEAVDITKEINNWQTVLQFGIPTPWMSFDFTFWGTRALVLEKLFVLDPMDNPYAVGVAILEALRKLSGNGVHSDIKPDNILKRVNEDGSAEYFLMDWEGLSTDKLYYGFVRLVWSPAWTSQVVETKQVTTMRNELIELSYTMYWLLLNQPGAEELKELIETSFNYRHIQKWRAWPAGNLLAQYSEYVKQIDERHITDHDFQTLIQMLSTALAGY